MSVPKGGFIGPLPRGQRDGRVTEARKSGEEEARSQFLFGGGRGNRCFIRHYGRANDKMTLSLARSGRIFSIVIVFVVSAATEGP